MRSVSRIVKLIYEIAQDGSMKMMDITELTDCDSQPDLLTNNQQNDRISGYYCAEENTYYYLLYDYERGGSGYGAERYYVMNIDADNVLHLKEQCRREEYFGEVTYYDSEDSVCTEERYEQLKSEPFIGMEWHMLHMEWIHEITKESLLQSYRTFCSFDDM